MSKYSISDSLMLDVWRLLLRTPRSTLATAISTPKEFCDMASPVEKDKAKKGIKARQDAMKTLIERHQDEFDDLHARNRVALGLSPRSAGPSREQLERQRERLEKWQRELDLAR